MPGQPPLAPGASTSPSGAARLITLTRPGWPRSPTSSPLWRAGRQATTPPTCLDQCSQGVTNHDCPPGVLARCLRRCRSTGPSRLDVGGRGARGCEPITLPGLAGPAGYPSRPELVLGRLEPRPRWRSLSVARMVWGKRLEPCDSGQINRAGPTMTASVWNQPHGKSDGKSAETRRVEHRVRPGPGFPLDGAVGSLETRRHWRESPDAHD